MSRIISRGFGVGGSAASTIVTRGYGEASVSPTPAPDFNPRDQRRELLLPGIRWANVPKGKPGNIVKNGTRVEHVNTIMNVVMSHSEHGGDLSGVIRYRFRPLPSRIAGEDRGKDQFGNPVYPFTGR